MYDLAANMGLDYEEVAIRLGLSVQALDDLKREYKSSVTLGRSKDLFFRILYHWCQENMSCKNEDAMLKQLHLVFKTTYNNHNQNYVEKLISKRELQLKLHI